MFGGRRQPLFSYIHIRRKNCRTRLHGLSVVKSYSVLSKEKGADTSAPFNSFSAKKHYIFDNASLLDFISVM